MDWQLAIERNREALKRIVAMLVAMAGCASLTSPPAGEDGPARQGEAEPLAGPGEGGLPRHLHRAILRLLRPAESAVRRLVIVAARGLVVALPLPRQRQPQPNPAILHNGVGTGIVTPAIPPGTRTARRTIALPLLDPLRPVRLRRPAATGVPRISLPGVTALFPVAPRRPPAPDDIIDATRLSLRLKALGIALDDLPKQARRFARWQARPRKIKVAQNGAGQDRRVWPLRPGRPPGQRPARQRTHEVHEILHDLHGLAFDALERPDTS